jgi:hypothetical protein
LSDAQLIPVPVDPLISRYLNIRQGRGRVLPPAVVSLRFLPRKLTANEIESGADGRPWQCYSVVGNPALAAEFAKAFAAKRPL